MLYKIFRHPPYGHVCGVHRSPPARDLIELQVFSLLKLTVALMLSLHPNIIVHVENVVSLFSSPSTSSQKVRECGSHKFLSQCGQFLPLLLRSCPSLQRCCWKMMLHPNIIVHVENVVSLFSSPSTSSQKV